MAFSKHLTKCLASGQFHKFQDCPLLKHVCRVCGKRSEGDGCKICVQIARKQARSQKLNMRAQTFDFGLAQTSIDSIERVLSNFASDLANMIPAVSVRTYEDVKTQMYQDLSFLSTKPDTVVHLLTTFALLIRVWGDVPTVGLLVLQCLSAYGVTADVANWVVEVFQNLYKNVGDTLKLNAQIGLPTIVTAILSLMHVVIFKTKPSWIALTTFVFQMSRVQSVGTGVASLLEACAEAGRLLKRWMSCVFLGEDVDSVEATIEPFLDWSEEVDDLYRCNSRKDFVWELEHLEKFDSLYERGVKMRRDTLWLNKDRAVMSAFTTRMNMLTKLQDEVNSNNIRQRTRLEPYLLYLYGESAVGKSLLTPMFVLEYMGKHHADELKTLNYDHNACCYVRKSGDPRWDGVGKQKVIIYDDFMQVKDSSNLPSTELFEMIEISNSAPFNPLMAQLEKKGKVRLEPELVLITSNVQQPAIKSLEKPIAVYRRFNMILEVLPKDEVCTNAVIDHVKLATRHQAGDCGCDGMDSNVCLNACNYQRWRVEQYLNNNVMECRYVRSGDLMTYTEVMNSFHGETQVHRDRGKSRQDFFKKMGARIAMQAQVGSTASDTSFCTALDEDDFVDPDLKDIAGDLYDDGTDKCCHKQSWLRQRINKMLHSARSFWKEHPLAMIMTSVLSLVGGFYLGKTIAAHFDKDVEEQLIPESDDSMRKMETRRQGKQSWRAENEDSMRKMETRRQGKQSWRAENDDSIKSSGSKGRPAWRAEVNDSFITMQEYHKFADNVKDAQVEMVAEGISDPNLLPVMKKAYRQTYIIQTRNGVRIGSGVMVRGRIFLTFGHCAAYLKENPFSLVNVQTWVFYECEPLTDYQSCGDATDLILFEVPRRVPQGMDLTSSFVNDEAICMKNDLNVRLFVPAEHSLVYVGAARAQDRVLQYSLDDTQIVVRKHYMYKFDTLPGYCGSLLFLSDKKSASKILGLHVCGADSVSLGIGSALCREALEDALTKLPLQAQCSLPLEEYGGDVEVKRPDFEPLGYAGVVARGITDQMHTKISRSPMYGWDGEPIKEPAQLCGRFEGECVKTQARMKLLKDEVREKDPIKLDLAMKTVEHVVGRSSTVKPKLWTLEQAAFGEEGTKYCDPLDMETSSGMPWKQMSKKNGKKGFLRKKNAWIRPDLADAVKGRIEKAKKGQRTVTVWSDHYKDELRLNEKVHKPRLFSGAPLDYTLAIRMYFGQFTSACMDGRIENGMAVGMNPHGPEWTLLANKLNDFSPHIFCGDYAKYDGSLDPDILWAVCDIVNLWYSDGNDLIRKTLFADIVNAVHLAGNVLYVMDHGNPSGNPLTAILNSLYQLVAMIYVLLAMGYTLDEILRHLKLVGYGDDNIVAVVGGAKWLPLDKLCKGLHDFLGMTLTNADKTGPPTYGTIETADFLGRTFREENGYFYAPRNWKNLSLIFNWVKSDEPWDSLSEAYSECCFYELSHYDTAGFVKYAKKLRDYCREEGHLCAPLYDIMFYRSTLQKWTGSGRFALTCWGI